MNQSMLFDTACPVARLQAQAWDGPSFWGRGNAISSHSPDLDLGQGRVD